MLKLLCPHCMKSVSVPDDSASKETPCPACGKSFPVPTRYMPVVAPAAVPPPPTPAVSPMPEPVPSHPLPIPHTTPLLPVGYTRSRGITISPCVVAWTPVICLTIILLLTLTPWVGVFPSGHPVYTQGAWRAITGWPTRDFRFEDLLVNDLPPPSISDRTPSDWLIMLPYLLVLILACVLAWAERLENNKSAFVSRRVPTLWPYRNSVIAILAGAALLLLAIEATRGFGLERAMDAAVAEKFAEARKEAKNPGDVDKVNFRQAQELAKYGLERTGWFCAVVVLHVLVLLAMLGRLALERRGNKPPPRIVVQY